MQSFGCNRHKLWQTGSIKRCRNMVWHCTFSHDLECVQSQLYEYLHARTQAPTCSNTSTYIHQHEHLHTPTRAPTCMNTSTHMHQHEHLHTPTRAPTCTNTSTYMYKHEHLHVHAQSEALTCPIAISVSVFQAAESKHFASCCNGLCFHFCIIEMAAIHGVLSIRTRNILCCHQWRLLKSWRHLSQALTMPMATPPTTTQS